MSDVELSDQDDASNSDPRVDQRRDPYQDWNQERSTWEKARVLHADFHTISQLQIANEKDLANMTEKQKFIYFLTAQLPSVKAFIEMIKKVEDNLSNAQRTIESYQQSLVDTRKARYAVEDQVILLDAVEDARKLAWYSAVDEMSTYLVQLISVFVQLDIKQPRPFRYSPSHRAISRWLLDKVGEPDASDQSYAHAEFEGLLVQLINQEGSSRPLQEQLRLANADLQEQKNNAQAASEASALSIAELENKVSILVTQVADMNETFELQATSLADVQRDFDGVTNERDNLQRRLAAIGQVAEDIEMDEGLHQSDLSVLEDLVKDLERRLVERNSGVDLAHQEELRRVREESAEAQQDLNDQLVDLEAKVSAASQTLINTNADWSRVLSTALLLPSSQDESHSLRHLRPFLEYKWPTFSSPSAFESLRDVQSSSRFAPRGFLDAVETRSRVTTSQLLQLAAGTPAMSEFELLVWVDQHFHAETEVSERLMLVFGLVTDLCLSSDWYIRSLAFCSLVMLKTRFKIKAEKHQDWARIWRHIVNSVPDLHTDYIAQACIALIGPPANLRADIFGPIMRGNDQVRDTDPIQDLLHAIANGRDSYARSLIHGYDVMIVRNTEGKEIVFVNHLQAGWQGSSNRLTLTFSMRPRDTVAVTWSQHERALDVPADSEVGHYFKRHHKSEIQKAGNVKMKQSFDAKMAELMEMDVDAFGF